jgi:hypothetical protein
LIGTAFTATTAPLLGVGRDCGTAEVPGCDDVLSTPVSRPGSRCSDSAEGEVAPCSDCKLAAGGISIKLKLGAAGRDSSDSPSALLEFAALRR